MNAKVKSAIQYFFILVLTAALLWFSLQGLQTTDGQDKWSLLLQTWAGSNKFFLLLMAVVALLSHWLRAARWRLLLAPTGNHVKIWNSFHSVMIGYFVNLAITRGGEISRSYNLYKLERTPIETSFGTVVAERIVDLICMCLLLGVAFLVEWDNLIAFFQELGIGAPSSGSFSIPIWFWVLMALGVVSLLVLYGLRKNEKLLRILGGFKKGLLAIISMEKKGAFIFYSIAIWILYFLMTYSVMLAFAQTANLGLGSVLILFAIGSVAMALPMPGGLGSYHTLMPLGLVMIYHVPKTDATAFVFVFHAWQTIVMIVCGLISLMCTSIIVRRRSAESLSIESKV